MKKAIIILDAGHGVNTPGKRSPLWSDGSQLREWEYTRSIVNRIATKLKELGVAYSLLVPEDTDIALSTRAARANEIYRKNGNFALLISVHGNAAGSGKASSATGWEVWTTKGKTKSDEFAEILCKNFKKVFPDKRLRTDKTDGDSDKEGNFTIIYKAACPAVLTENFFYDNESECKWMLTNDCIERVAELHVMSIVEWLKN